MYKRQVDKVIEIGANYIVGVKNITANEPFFQDHFPQEPVMPGVLQIEAMAQVGGLLVLNSVDEPERYSTYLDVYKRQPLQPFTGTVAYRNRHSPRSRHPGTVAFGFLPFIHQRKE